jgi:hypothetical protein
MSIKRYREKSLSVVKQEKTEERLPLQAIGQELALLKLERIQRESLIQTLGQELAIVKMELIELKGGENA